MPPRTMPLPGAQTDSARDLRRTFFCDLCQKGYARINEFEAHENSYDHQHKKRLKEMKAMTRQPPPGTKRKAEKSDMISINLQSHDVGKQAGSLSVGAKKDASRPVGWPAPAKSTNEARGFQSIDPRTKEGEAKSGPKEKEEEEEVWEERPLAWEELDEIDGMLDLDGRPAVLQRMVDGYKEHVEWRDDLNAQAGIWAKVEEMRSQMAKG